jgi:hypothetical protein
MKTGMKNSFSKQILKTSDQPEQTPEELKWMKFDLNSIATKMILGSVKGEKELNDQLLTAKMKISINLKKNPK